MDIKVSLFREDAWMGVRPDECGSAGHEIPCPALDEIGQI